MGKRLSLYLVTGFLAFGVLFASISSSASVKYVFGEVQTPIEYNIPSVDYLLPGTGLIAPDDPVWFLEVLRDQIILNVNQNELSKAELLLQIADKRIAYAEQLTHREQYGEAIEVAEKAEMYLQSSYDQLHLESGYDENLNIMLNDLGMASLKHREVLETMYIKSPDEARPKLSSITNTPKEIFEKVTHMMNELRVETIKNPFLTY